MQAERTPQMIVRRYGDERLTRELAFAEGMVDENDPSTIQWRDALRMEVERRASALEGNEASP